LHGLVAQYLAMTKKFARHLVMPQQVAAVLGLPI
jgi:hypothetical protein